MGFGMLGASFLLVAPIALWARFGDRAPLRSGAVALAAGLLCWALVRRVAARPASAGAPAALPLPETPPAPRRARPRSRRAPRDVGCPASARRPTRRRTRP
jgi:hypothetical protein